MILVVDRRDSTLRHEHGTLRLETPGEPPRRAPVNQLELVVVYGNPMAESGVWRALANAGVPAVLLPARGREGPAVLSNGLATQLPLRRMQHRLAAHPAAALEVARWVVRQKLLGYDLPLDALGARHGLSESGRAGFLATREQALGALAGAAGLDAVLGIEGQAAHAWFQLIADTLSPAWGFKGRNRRPPRDPLNALLSLGYTLVGAEVHHAVMAAGLDPSLGFLHQPYPGREAMVLDLTEVFRGGVDHFALSWLDPEGPDQSHWHYREQEGCRLSKARRPDFYSLWATRRAEWPYPQRPEQAPEWPWGSLREQINGWIERLRAELKRIEADASPATREDELDHDIPF